MKYGPTPQRNVEEFAFWLTRILGLENGPERARSLLKIARKHECDPQNVYEAASTAWKLSFGGTSRYLRYEEIEPDHSEITDKDYEASGMFRDVHNHDLPEDWDWTSGHIIEEIAPYWFIRERPEDEAPASFELKLGKQTD